MMRLKWTKRLLSIVLCGAVLCTGLYSNVPFAAEPVSAMTLEELQAEKEANTKQIAQKQKELDTLGSDKIAQADYQKTLEEKIALQQSNLQLTDEELTRLKDAITEKQQAISTLQNEIAVLDVEIAEGLEEFKLRLRAMYVQGNDSLASALVGSTDFYDFLTKYDLMSRIAKHDNDLVNELKANLENSEKKKAALEQEKADLTEQQDTEKKKKAEFADALMQLQDDYAKSTEEMERLAAEESMLYADIDALEKANAEKEAEEERMIEAIRKAAEEEARKKTSTTTTTTTTAATTKKSSKTTTVVTEKDKPKTTTAPKQTESEVTTKKTDAAVTTKKTTEATTKKTTAATTTTTKKTTTTTVPTTTTVTTTTAAPYNETQFAWPVPGFYYVSSGFGYRWGSTHKGIDVAGGGINGASVVASRSGTVIKVVSGCSHNYGKSSSCGCGGGYGNYVVIQHDDNTYSTLYAHMSSVNVSYGQYVSQGDVVGTVGSTGWSTGYHLHFEVMKNGTHVDPANYLF